jgi:hypothetical protein
VLTNAHVQAAISRLSISRPARLLYTLAPIILSTAVI